MCIYFSLFVCQYLWSALSSVYVYVDLYLLFYLISGVISVYGWLCVHVNMWTSNLPSVCPLLSFSPSVGTSTVHKHKSTSTCLSLVLSSQLNIYCVPAFPSNCLLAWLSHYRAKTQLTVRCLFSIIYFSVLHINSSEWKINDHLSHVIKSTRARRVLRVSRINYIWIYDFA